MLRTLSILARQRSLARSITGLVLISACGGHIKKELVGTGTAAIQLRGQATVPVDAATAPGAIGTIQLTRGTYDLALRFDLPHAQVIDWTVTCEGSTQQGSIGQTFEQYRAHRLDQLRRQREQDRRNVAAVTGAVVGAVTPDVNVQARASTDATATGPVVRDHRTYEPNPTPYPTPPVGRDHRTQQPSNATPPSPYGGPVVRDHRTHGQPSNATPPGPYGGPAVRDHRTHGQASAPHATATATATVDATISGQAVGDAAGNAIANATVSDVVELAPGDVGGGSLRTRVHLTTQADGACVVTATADDANVRAFFEVTRVRDLDAEARVRIMAANSGARQVRGQLNVQLVALGADPMLRQRQREAEVRARYEAEMANARARAEAQAAIEVQANAQYVIEVRRRQTAHETRAALIAYLGGVCGADPHRRDRLRAQAAAERAQRDARDAQIQIEVTAQRDARQAQRDARQAELDAQRNARQMKIQAELDLRHAREAELAEYRARRTQRALAVRGHLIAYLEMLGARQRPPMPAPLPEVPGSSPFDGAAWIAGRWVWSGAQWAWEAGGWRDTTMFGAAGRIGGVISVGGGGSATFGLDASDVVPNHDRGMSTTPPNRDHRTVKTPSRDHRNDLDDPPPPPVKQQPSRDHRSEPKHEPSRDHRSEPTSTPSRDHRKKDDDKDDKPSRDHRRR